MMSARGKNAGTGNTPAGTPGMKSNSNNAYSSDDFVNQQNCAPGQTP